MTDEVSKQTAVAAGVCGVLLLICGTGCIISGFVLIGNNISTADGLWSGALLLITGVLGIVTWSKRHRGVITGFLVLTIFGVVALFIQSIIAGVRYSDNERKAKVYCKRINDACYCSDEYAYTFRSPIKDLYCDKSKMDTIIGSLLAIVLFSVIGGIVTFTGSIIGCMGTCSVQAQPGAVIVQRPVIVTTSTLHGYSVQQPGYSVQQPGYSVQQPGYSVQQPGYSVQQPGHQAPQSDYQAPQSGYQVPGSDYQAPHSGYQASQPAYAAPQASSSQQQVPDEPPPEYTKHAL